MIRKHLEENKDVIIVEYLPKGSPGNNAIEECWRQGKDDLLVSKYYPKFPNLKCAIANYYRTKRFKLDITKYLLRNVTSELMLGSINAKSDVKLFSLPTTCIRLEYSPTLFSKKYFSFLRISEPVLYDFQFSWCFF